MLSAALTSRRFAQLLLSDPINALAQGIWGYEFTFTTEELAVIGGIRAATLEEFAEELKAALTPLDSR